jgi:outer membrane protein assembly factor BamB
MTDTVHKNADKLLFLAGATPLGLVAAAVVSMFVWLSGDPAAGLKLRLPAERDLQQDIATENGAAQSEAEFLRFNGVPAELPDAWPRFRGADLDAISKQDTPLARTWPPGGPTALWSVELGEGYAGPAVLAGRVYVLDYNQEKQADAIRCFSLADGKEIWRYSYPVKIKRNHGMSRTVPAVTEEYIVTLGPKLHVTCLESMTGELRWRLDLVGDFSARVPPWYAGQCPLIEDGKAIIAVGGDALVMAVDCQSGEIVWQSPNPHGWVMTHSSVMPTDFAGLRMYVYCASGGVVGVSADDGSILWEFPDWKIRIANVPSPVIVGEGRIFLSGGYNAGAVMLQLQQEGEQISAHEVFRVAPEVFGAPQHTPIFYQGYIYGVRPDGQFTCLGLNGNVVWTSSSAHRFGLGPYVIADGLIYVMDDSGLLTVAEATPAGYVPLDSAEVLDGPESWGPMAVAGGRLLVRDLRKMVCLDIRRQ